MSSINFSRILYTDDCLNESKNLLIIRIKGNSKGELTQTLPSIDRCCKSFENPPNASHKNSIRDKIPRALCNISKEYFLSEYVQKRKAVILLGCQNKWNARKWTFKGRYLLNWCSYCQKISY